MTKQNPFPEDANALLRREETIALALAANRSELVMRRNVEGLLRATITAAVHVINTYISVVEGANNAQAPLNPAANAKARCDRNIRKWRRRIIRSIARLCRYISDDDLNRTAEFVLAVGG